MKFRYDINALRAIAVLGVLLFHFKVPYWGGGFSGVDVFFVISGYLMTKIIIKGIDDRTFSLVDFYSRRLKRIVPALLALIVTLTCVCFFLYFPFEFKTFQKNAAGSIAFISNIIYGGKANYFSPGSDTNILLHTWSLSVEWQFYLLYPVVLLLANKIWPNKKWHLVFFSTAIVAIFLVSAFYSHRNQSAAFYLLPTRSWEMLAGGMAFLLESRAVNFKYKKAAAILAYLGIIAGSVFLSDQLYWPGVATLLPVLLTTVIIILNVNDIKLLQHKAVQFTGQISYSLYLWHWPVIVLAHNVAGVLNTAGVVVCLVISFILAAFSYKYIESYKGISNKVTLAAMAVICVVCYTFSYLNVNSIVFKPQTLAIANYGDTHDAEIAEQFNTGGCFLATDEARLKDLDQKNCLKFETDSKNMLLIGDSHAAALSASLKVAFTKRHVNLLQATGIGCLPLVNDSGKIGCTQLINYIYRQFIVNNASKIQGVIICAQWANSNDHRQLLAELDRTISHLSRYKIKTAIIGQNETYVIAYPHIAAREFQYGVTISRRYLNPKAYKVNDLLKQQLQPYYVNIYDEDTVPPLTRAHIPYMFDTDHYTRYGADLTVDKLLADPIMQKLLAGKK